MTTPPATGINERPPKPVHWPRTLAIVLVLIGLTVWSAFAIDVDFGAIWRNFHNASRNVSELMRPNFGFFPETKQALLETLEMAVIATAAASAIGLPLSFLASRATNPHSKLRLATRSVMNIVRSVPDLLSASLLVTAVGTGALPGIMAMILFNVGIIVKLISETLDSLDRGGQEAARAAGASWLEANRQAMLPEVAPNYISQTIYVFEVNIRAATVIGLVGGGGIGVLIDRVRTYYQYSDLSFIILEILVLIVALEFLSSFVRKRLLRSLPTSRPFARPRRSAARSAGRRDLPVWSSG